MRNHKIKQTKQNSKTQIQELSLHFLSRETKKNCTNKHTQKSKERQIENQCSDPNENHGENQRKCEIGNGFTCLEEVRERKRES